MPDEIKQTIHEIEVDLQDIAFDMKRLNNKLARLLKYLEAEE